MGRRGVGGSASRAAGAAGARASAKLAGRIVLAVGLLGILVGCPEPPPPGTDTVDLLCICRDSCSGEQIAIPALICTDASNPDNVDTARKFACEKKETIGTPGLCKIENCGPGGGIGFITQGACPADNGDFFTGDFGQAVSEAVPPSTVRVEGDDIIDFNIVPETFHVETTQTGSELFFGNMVGTLATTTFESDGIFSNDDHTLSEGQLAGAPFKVTLEPSGDFVVPPGTGTFIVTGKVDGTRMSLTLTNISLEGTYDEEAGLFTLSGLVDAQGADINMRVNLVMQFTNRPPRAVAGDDVVVECDSTAGTGGAFLSGAGSFDLDGPQDLARFAWYVDGAEAATGQDALVPIPLGQHEVSLSVADLRGSFGVDTLGALVQDTTAPTIGITEPRPIAYVHSATLTLDYSVVDGCTGVGNVSPLLDGSSTVGGHGLPDGQAINLLTELALGSHTFSIDSTDAEGNPSSASVTFSIIVTAESIQEDVRQFVASGAITQSSYGQFLLGKLAAAASSRAKGNCGAAAATYNAVISSVMSQTGKSITPTAAAILIADARYLIAHCP
jgi:hypothetical protein